MSRGRGLSWVVLGVWAAWLLGFQALLASPGALGDWTPELALLVLLALDGRLSHDRAFVVVLVLALARVAFSADPPLAVVAAYLFAFGATRSIGRVFEVQGPFRALLAGALALALGSFLELARALRLDSAGLAAGGFAGLEGPLPWRAAVSTALLALVALPLFARLPGVSPLWRRGWSEAWRRA